MKAKDLRALSRDTLPALCELLKLTSGDHRPTFQQARDLGPDTTEVRFRPALGLTIDDYRARASNLEEALCAYRIVVTRTAPGHGAIRILWRDPWPRTIPWEWPADVWADGVTIASDVMGDRIVSPLLGAHWLLAGQTGSGKTSVLHCIAGGAAVAEGGHILVGICPKGTELTRWRPRMSALASADVSMSMEILRRCERHAKRNFEIMRANELEKVTRPIPELGIQTLTLVIDEGKALIEEAGKEALQILGRIAYLYRSAGVGIVVAYQSPTADEVGALRRNLGRRLCFKVESSAQSAMILGTHGYAAESLPLGSGQAYIQIEGVDGARLVKAHWLDADDRKPLAKITAPLRPESTIFDDLDTPAPDTGPTPLEQLATLAGMSADDDLVDLALAAIEAGAPEPEVRELVRTITCRETT